MKPVICFEMLYSDFTPAPKIACATVQVSLNNGILPRKETPERRVSFPTKA